MSGLPEDRIAGDSQDDGLLLEYDYFKHLSTIALVAIGALLTWMQANGGAGARGMVALGVIALSALLSFSAMNQIVGHRKTGKALRRLFRWEWPVAALTFVIGVAIVMHDIARVAK